MYANNNKVLPFGKLQCAVCLLSPHRYYHIKSSQQSQKEKKCHCCYYYNIPTLYPSLEMRPQRDTIICLKLQSKSLEELDLNPDL